MEDKAREIISRILEVPIEDVKDEASLVDDLMADSLDVVELVMAFEEEFQIEIPDRDAERITTVAEAITYLQGVV
jgi:acyl carrier protein